MAVNLRLVRERDEARFGVRQLLPREQRDAPSSTALRRSQRLSAHQHVTSPPAQSHAHATTKRTRSHSNAGELSQSSDLGTQSGKRRAGRQSRDSQTPAPAPPKPQSAVDILASMQESFAATLGKISAGINLPEESSEVAAEEPSVQSTTDGVAYPELAGKYEVIERVGEGAYGAVFKAVRLQSHPRGAAPSGQLFAIKRIPPVVTPLRILTEIRFLRTHGGVHHVIKLEEVINGGPQYPYISIVFPLFTHHQWPEFYWKLPAMRVLSYMHQLLEALAHIHQAHLIHRDIKPTNCLYNVETDELVLIDFGFAEFEPKYLTTAVSRIRNLMVANRAGTRGFRAPEVLLSSMEQTSAVDVWSAGVLLLSFLTARHPFFKNTTRELLHSLCELAAMFGTRDLHTLAARENMTIQFPPPLDTQEEPAFASLEEFCLRYRSSDVPALEATGMPRAVFDLLERMLQVDPKRRITAREALRHPVFLDAGFKEPTFAKELVDE